MACRGKARVRVWESTQATGMVGQRFVQLLTNHPGFRGDGAGSVGPFAGKPFGEACTWRLVGDMPAFGEIDGHRAAAAAAAGLVMWCFSSLPSDVARASEENFARAGYPVISNASSEFRMDADVPLLIPEINSDHLDVLPRQRSERGYRFGLHRNESGIARRL